MTRKPDPTSNVDRRGEAEGADDLASTPPAMWLSRTTVLTPAGARTLVLELDDSKPPVVGERLRALVRGLRPYIKFLPTTAVISHSSSER